MSINDAARDDNLELVRVILLATPGAVDQRDVNGLTPLIIAVQRDQLAMAQLLLTVGNAAVNQRT